MRIPDEFRAAIDRQVQGIDQAALRRASAEMTAAYKSADYSRPVLRSEAHRLAYALVRAPATYAANFNVAQHLRSTVPELRPARVLDLGAGTGIAAWAFADVFSSIEEVTLVEQDAELIRLGQKFASMASNWRSEWLASDIRGLRDIPASDLVVFSYSIGELQPSLVVELLQRAWSATRQALVVIEPGTRRGFERVLLARETLIEIGAQLAAPCPHMQQCPMSAAGDWCHFAQRVERTSEHRRLKDGSLGYEDEKFSYVAASRLPVAVPQARIVRHPQIFSGYVKLQLCCGPVLDQQTVTRSQKNFYKEARHARWGDSWDHLPPPKR